MISCNLQMLQYSWGGGHGGGHSVGRPSWMCLDVAGHIHELLYPGRSALSRHLFPVDPGSPW